MWEAYLFHTTSGQLGPKIAVDSATWGISLNESEDLKVGLRKADLPTIDLKKWLSAWFAGVVLTYNGRAIVAGPIISNPVENRESISLQCGGIRHVLAARLVIQEQRNWNALSTQYVYYKGLSLGTIAKKVVQLAQEKPAGTLPIDYPYADQGVKEGADHERTYRSFNLSNIFADDVLTKLSEVIDGPDIMFRPKIVRSGGTMFVRFDMVYGSEDLPRIPQLTSPEWDTTAQNSGVTNISLVSTGAHQTNRVFSIGAGEDEGTLIRMVEDLSATQEGYPFLESVWTSSDSEDPAVVLAHAQAGLAQNKDSLLELSLSVRADEAPFDLGSYFVGDQIRIRVKDWIKIPDGNHKARLLGMSGNLSNEVKLSVQLEAGN